MGIQVLVQRLFLALAFWIGLSEAASLMKKLDPRARHSLNKRNIPDFVDWGCPDLNCPPVKADCEMMEVVAFRYEHGECLGCPYCIDLPDHLKPSRQGRSLRVVKTDSDVMDMPEGLAEGNERSKRSASRNRNLFEQELCSQVTCPVAPPSSSCRHPGMLEGYLRRRVKCISCPTCLDSHHSLH